MHSACGFRSPIAATLLLLTILSSAGAKYGGGSGTAADPYQIWTAEQMNAIGLHEQDWSGHFMLMEDIDLAAHPGASFNLIGRYVGWLERNTPFTGVFDGGGKTIRSFHYSGSTDAESIGLFRILGEGALVKNLKLEGVDIDVQDCVRVGVLAGFNAGGTIANCHVAHGRIKSEGQEVGGLAGAT
jgi:trimeric autotransporter adhesin